MVLRTLNYIIYLSITLDSLMLMNEDDIRIIVVESILTFIDYKIVMGCSKVDQLILSILNIILTN